MVAFAAFLAFFQARARPEPNAPWVREGLSIAVREGLVPIRDRNSCYGYDAKLGPTSRWEAAAHAHGAATAQRLHLEAALEGKASDLQKASLLRSRVLLPFYRRIEKEYVREWTSLGVTDGLGVRRLEELDATLRRQSPPLTHPFRDVPSDHWAAKAVGDLRALGLLNGYPDGSFRG